MSTATLERPQAADVIEWGDWAARDTGGKGERRYIVSRHQINWEGQRAALGEWHVNASGTQIKYTLAGAEKKAHELNRKAADEKRWADYRAEQERRKHQLQMMAREVRGVAMCGTENSEAIAAWIIENFTDNDEVQWLKRETEEFRQELTSDRAELIGDLNTAIDIAKRADKAIEGIGRAVAQLEAPGALEFAYGNTEAEKVLDLLSDGINAVDEYMQNPNNSDLPEKRKA